MDKAARAALLTAKGKDNASENIADYVADLLRQGRAKEVTDDLMAQADPQRLHHHYTTGNTGVDMPMDQASRMARAKGMGIDTDRPLYHGTSADAAKAIEKSRFYSRAFASPSRRVADEYADNVSGSGDSGIVEFVANPAKGGIDYDMPGSSIVDFGNGDPEFADAWRQDLSMGFHPSGVRSLSARFDPRLDHLAHLNASAGGAMDFARHVEAVHRAGGQIAPSKYMPNVPRQVHADGGPAMFQGIHQDLQGEGGAPLDLYHGSGQDKEFEAFDNAKLGARDAGFYGRGHYLTPVKGNAEGYADPDEMGKGTVIGPLHAALKNPYLWDVSSDMKSHSTLRDLQSMGIMREKNELNPWDNLQQHHIQPFMAEMQKRGHDGVIVKTSNEDMPNGISEVVAFNPNTIKHKDAEVFDPNDPRIRREDGGRIHAEGGGKMELRSRAAEAIRNQPQLKGNVNQLLAVTAKGKGVKQAELANAGRPSGNIISKEELAQHFERAVPKVQVEKYGDIAPIGHTEDEKKEYNHLSAERIFNKADDNQLKRLRELEDKLKTKSDTKYGKWTFNVGKNYREHLLHMPPEGVEINHRVFGAFPKDFETEAEAHAYIDRMNRGAEEPGMEPIRDSLRNFPLGYHPENKPNDKTFQSSHWDMPNVIAHVRMKDLNRGDNLFVQEVQSDWGQSGREQGFYDPQNPYEVVRNKTKEVVSRHPDHSSMWDAYRTHPESDNLNYGDARDEKVPQAPYVGNTQQWTDLALKHVLTEAAKGGHKRVVFAPGQANADLYGQRQPISRAYLTAPVGMTDGLGYLYTRDKASDTSLDPIYIKDEKELINQLGRKHAKALLSQEPIVFGGTSDRAISEPDMHLGGHGMVEYYNNIVHPSALKLLQQHDPSIQPEKPYAFPGKDDESDDYKGYTLPMTDTARQSILKNGFGAFKRGGSVGEEEGGHENGDFEVGKKYNGVIQQIKYLPVHAIERQPSEHEVSRVSDDVARSMDFSEPVEATAFRYSSNHSEDHPSVALQNGHHRLAAARQTGRPHLPVTLTAVNAKGEKLNALKALSDEIERSMITKANGGAVGDDDPAPDIQNPMSIFPKPQRMFPEDQRPKGGQYISAHNKVDVTGHKAEAATIGIGPNGKPFFYASQNAVDQTGTVGKGSATTKTNLFKQKAGWKWQDAPEGHENTETIVSVEHRGKHFYALNAHFPKGVDLARYENATSEPRLRPTTQGNVTLGPQAGSISVRGKMHPVYHHVIVKADGGSVDDAIALTRRFTKDGAGATMALKPKGK